MAWNPLKKDEPQSEASAERDSATPIVDAARPDEPQESEQPKTVAEWAAMFAQQSQSEDAEAGVTTESGDHGESPLNELDSRGEGEHDMQREGGEEREAEPVPEAGQGSEAESQQAAEEEEAHPPFDLEDTVRRPVEGHQAMQDAASDQGEPNVAAEDAVPAVVASEDPVAAEQARLARERAARREARMAALAPVREEDPLAPEPVVEPVKPVKRVTDGFGGSLGLFALRLVAALSLFVQGLNGVINQKAATDVWANTVLPAPRYVALGIAGAELVVALMLLFGLATRLAGVGALAVMGLTLAFVMWGPWSIFELGGTGFIGERELLLAVIGLALLLLGGGAWSIDYGIRRGRRNEQLSDRTR